MVDFCSPRVTVGFAVAHCIVCYLAFVKKLSLRASLVEVVDVRVAGAAVRMGLADMVASHRATAADAH